MRSAPGPRCRCCRALRRPRRSPPNRSRTSSSPKARRWPRCSTTRSAGRGPTCRPIRRGPMASRSGSTVQARPSSGAASWPRSASIRTCACGCTCRFRRAREYGERRAIGESAVTTLQRNETTRSNRYAELKPGEAVPVIDVVATASDEPDHGFDIGLWEDSGTPYGRLYGFGKQPFGANPAGRIREPGAAPCRLLPRGRDHLQGRAVPAAHLSRVPHPPVPGAGRACVAQRSSVLGLALRRLGAALHPGPDPAVPRAGAAGPQRRRHAVDQHAVPGRLERAARRTRSRW